MHLRFERSPELDRVVDAYALKELRISSEWTMTAPPHWAGTSHRISDIQPSQTLPARPDPAQLNYYAKREADETERVKL